MAALRNGCALALAMTAIAQAPLAHATGFQGTGAVVPGSGSASIVSGATNDTITVDTPEVVIDWTPTDTAGTGTINFLPSSNSVLYTDNSSAGLTGYTVLNRILPVDGSGTAVTNRAVAFNGTVTTQLGAANFPVGNVWFYSPGGIIAGPTAVFDVGGLVLSTSTIDSTAGFGSSNEIRFTGTPNSTSGVEIQPGAQINVVNPGSYVALVAPRVVQGGTVSVNGSVAYVGAEAATLRINGGLFDIAIGTGTADANGVVHTGTTNLTPDAGTQRAFMAAVPKNTALTMLLTGDVGYSTAAVATFQDTAVILSAGHDISFGQSLGLPNSSATASANISIGNSSFLPAVEGRASGSITINPTSLGTISFAQNATFKAATAITAGADNGETINANGDLTLDARTGGTGGIATLYADGIPFSTPPAGQVNVVGALTVSSSAMGLDNFTAGATGGDATGGISEIRANGGSISAGSIFMQSTAQSGYGSAAAGTATGGTARINLTSVNGGGSITAAGNVSIDVSANGPFFSVFGAPVIGATATGGTVQVSTDGGTLSFAALNINADASGGQAASGGTAGQATGGDITISTRTSGTGLGTIALTDCTNIGCFISADATGGRSFDGANGTGGDITLTAQDGLFAADGAFSVYANGFGGAEETGGTTGSGFGGNVLLQILPGVANNGAMVFADLSVSADGAGLPIPGDYSGSGNGGLGQGGSVRFDLLGGALDATSITMSGSGLGGPVGESSSATPFIGGDGRGGQAVFNLNGGFADVGTLALNTFGEGGLAEFPSMSTNLIGTPGNGFGGTSQFIAASGTMTISDLFVHASARGGSSPSPFDYNSIAAGNGTGGTAAFTFSGANLSVNSLQLFANGAGGDGGEGFSSTSTGNAGSGGNGTGGAAAMALGSGNLTLTSFAIAATGTGGAGGDNQGTGNAGSGGDGFGGSAILDGTDAEYAFAGVTLDARGIGGSSGTAMSGLPGIVGNGTGGFARLTNAGTATPVLGRIMDSLTLDVSGTGTSILSGRAEISDTASSAGGGLIVNGDLSVLGTGTAASGTSGFYFMGSGDPISIGGNATILVGGNAAFAIDGTGTFDVAGTLQVDSGQDISVSHANQLATPADTISASSITFNASGSFSAAADTVIRSATGIDILTFGGNAGSSGNLLASDFINIASAADALVNNATVSGGGLVISGPGNAQIIGTVVAGTDVDVLVGGLIGANNLTAIGGDVSLEGNGNITVTQASAGDEVLLTSRGGTVNAVTLTSGTGLASGLPGDSYSTGILALGNIAVGSVTSAADASFASITGDIALGQVITADNLGVFAANGINLGSVDAGQFVYLAGIDTLSSLPSLDPPLSMPSIIPLPPAANAGAIIVTGNFDAAQALVSTGTDFAIQGNANIQTDLNAFADGAITLSALSVAGTIQAQGRSVDIASPGALNVTLASASGGNLRIIANNGLSVTTGTASGAITLGSGLADISVTDLTGSSVDIGTLGTASFAGLTQGQTVQVNSGNIVIGAGAQLGTAGTTTLLTLANSRTVNPTFLGGTGSTTGYSLSATELGRLFADSITISGTFGGTGQPDVVVDSFTMTSRAGTPGGNLGANGSLSILSAGNIQVIGDVALTGLGSGNQLFFTAQGANGPAAIEVDAANASISLSDANGALAGQVNFEADDVFIATSKAIADIRAATDTDAIAARLALNDGVVRNGVVSASTISADVGGGLYIQNTAASTAFADRRGFAALTDTLDIVTRSAATRIVVNGVLVDAVAGTMLTGLDVIPLVRVNGVVGPASGNFDPRSTVNGCLIASPLLCTVNVEELPNLPPPHENIETVLDPDGGSAGSDLFPAMIVELKDFVPFGYPPLIDEPVTGAGNDDLWMPACDNGKEGGCIAQ